MKLSSSDQAPQGLSGFRPPTAPWCGLLRCRQTWNIIFGIKSANEAVITWCGSQRSSFPPF